MKDLPTQLVEGQVSAVPEVDELEVVVAQPVERLHQPIEGDDERVSGAVASTLGDHGLVLELRELGDLERLERGYLRLHLLAPALVQCGPVLVVEAAPPGEELGTPRQLGLVGH